MVEGVGIGGAGKVVCGEVRDVRQGARRRGARVCAVARFYLYQMLGDANFDAGLRDFSAPGRALRPTAYAAYQGRSDPSRAC